jgi:Na+-driven multidrug efflux pump
MGTAGVGYATVAAQGVSALLTVRALIRTDDIYRLELSKIRIDRRMMARVLKIGIPSGIQQSIISLSNVIVQANVNSFGAAAMAGFGSYSKIDGFAMLPLQSFCMAATTFTGQNIGAKKSRRVKQGVFQGLVISMIYTILISIILYFNAERILRVFSPDHDVIAYGYSSMLILLPFYWTMAIHQILMGSIRGSGRTMVTMLIGVGNMCILRMIYINLLVPFFPSFEAVMWCYPITWLTTMGMDGIYALKAKWIPKGKEDQIGEKSQ